MLLYSTLLWRGNTYISCRTGMIRRITRLSYHAFVTWQLSAWWPSPLCLSRYLSWLTFGRSLYVVISWVTLLHRVSSESIKLPKYKSVLLMAPLASLNCCGYLCTFSARCALLHLFMHYVFICVLEIWLSFSVNWLISVYVTCLFYGVAQKRRGHCVKKPCM